MNIQAVISPAQLEQHQAHKARRAQWAAKAWTPAKSLARPRPVNVALLKAKNYNSHVRDYLFNNVLTKKDIDQHVKDYRVHAVIMQEKDLQDWAVIFNQRRNKVSVNDVIRFLLSSNLTDGRASTQPDEISMEQIKGKTRTNKIVLVRQLAMYFVNKHMGKSYVDVGHRFGGRDHTTALHAVRRITALIKDKKLFINNEMVTVKTRIF